MVFVFPYRDRVRDDREAEISDRSCWTKPMRTAYGFQSHPPLILQGSYIVYRYKTAD